MTYDRDNWRQLRHNDVYAEKAGKAKWADWCVALSVTRGYAICGGRRRDGSDAPCQQRPRKGRQRCAVHGGASLVGHEAPGWKGRGYSSDIPTRLADRFRKALDDPELTSMTSEIALIDTRLGELLQKFELKESAEAWNMVVVASASIRLAIENARTRFDEKDTADVERLAALYAGVDQLDAAIDAGSRDRSLWHELFATMEQRRRLVETEGKREDRLQQMITARQTMEVFGALQAIITDEIDDPERLKRIAERLRALLYRDRADRRLTP